MSPPAPKRPDPAELARIAHEVRLAVVRMNHTAGSGHTGGSLSCAEILTVLYDAVLNVRPDQPDWPDRDRFVLSKGHGAPALYATLARKGFFDAAHLDTLRQTGSILQGHPCARMTPGVDLSSGSLGMGISAGLGMALAARVQSKAYRVFVVCGDGELQEGQNWEALMAVAKWRPADLTIIVDRNGVQLDGPIDEIMPLGDLDAKLHAFGLHTLECDGHDAGALLEAIDEAVQHDGPVVVVARTVKGKGVSFMEGQAAWHGKPISDDDYALAIKELEEAR